jgi:hypothetical protein
MESDVENSDMHTSCDIFTPFHVISFHDTSQNSINRTKAKDMEALVLDIPSMTTIVIRSRRLC